MARKIFVSLPVGDLEKSKAFFAALGFAFDAQFTGEHAASIVVNDDAQVMLLTRPQFEQLSPLPAADARAVKEVLISLSCESRAEVDALVAKAVAAGGKSHNAAQDHGFMYDHDFIDLDGHAWGVFWMNPTPAP
jgi:predicted lactoylglutathione lyase